jgi:cytochrome c-type biogenesis protein CcmH
VSWILVILVALAAYLGLIFVLKLPRGGREITGAALVLGLAGYAAQGSPGLPGQPTQPRETVATGQAALIETRKALGEESAGGSSFLITADALARQGQFATAAGLLRAAMRKTPDDPDLWIALGNALVGHADGTITPAGLYAYRRAAEIAPGHPGPPFFTGLALAQSGRFEDARAIWAELLAKPGNADAPWRAGLASRLKQLDALIAMRAAMQAGMPPASGPAPAP